MIPFKKSDKSEVVPPHIMKEIYEKIKTPIKHGAVMKWDTHHTDSPSIFFYEGSWYLAYVAISKNIDVSGYETHIAKSLDLYNWETIGTIFSRNDKNHWDSKQCAGYVAFPDIIFGGSNTIHPINGSYYMSYLAGNSDGYEPDPLFMGLAKTPDPTCAEKYVRFPEPILRPDDKDARENETKTLYKSYIFEDIDGLTGYPYVNAFNAKAENATERIFLAVSSDGEHWERYGDKPIIDDVSDDPTGCISGDPQIVKIGDVYVMFYFRYHGGKPAYNTFACSYDLVHWTRWEGEPLVYSTEEWENIHAHKSWVVCHEGTVYHFYCAVNDKNERFIALATSK